MTAPRRKTLLKTYSRRDSRRIASRPSALQRLTQSRIATTQSVSPAAAADVQTAAKGVKEVEHARAPRAPRRATVNARASSSDDAAAASESSDYDPNDDITGHEFKRETAQVLLLARRHADMSCRLVPERHVQRKAPTKLYDYWASFGQPREVTLGTDLFHIFDIIGRDPAGRLKVQWEGYGTSDRETTLEPARKVRSLNPAIMCRYLERERVGA